MNRIKHGLVLIALFAAFGLAAASSLSVLAKSARPARTVAPGVAVESGSPTGEPIQPMPRHVEFDLKKVELGRRLFQDVRLSKDNSVSCASCHDLRGGGADSRAASLGIGGAIGEINAPTVFNSGFNFRQFWDGRAETLEDQIDGPVHHPRELGSDWPQILEKLRADPDCVLAFSGLYRDGVSESAVKDCIATFERSLITSDSRFDRFLRGDKNAISAEEKEGYRLFKENGCSSCHQGVLVGGNMFEKFGIVADYFADRGHVVRADLGRFNVTGRESDRYAFKVPALRNAARTAPYFHDGSAKTLEEAVDVMARYQLGRELSPDEIRRIAQFLKSLDGESTGAGS